MEEDIQSEDESSEVKLFKYLGINIILMMWFNGEESMDISLDNLCDRDNNITMEPTKKVNFIIIYKFFIFINFFLN